MTPPYNPDLFLTFGDFELGYARLLHQVDELFQLAQVHLSPRVDRGISCFNRLFAAEGRILLHQACERRFQLLGRVGAQLMACEAPACIQQNGKGKGAGLVAEASHEFDRFHPADQNRVRYPH